MKICCRATFKIVLCSLMRVKSIGLFRPDREELSSIFFPYLSFKKSNCQDSACLAIRANNRRHLFSTLLCDSENFAEGSFTALIGTWLSVGVGVTSKNYFWKFACIKNFFIWSDKGNIKYLMDLFHQTYKKIIPKISSMLFILVHWLYVRHTLYVLYIGF